MMDVIFAHIDMMILSLYSKNGDGVGVGGMHTWERLAATWVSADNSNHSWMTWMTWTCSSYILSK